LENNNEKQRIRSLDGLDGLGKTVQREELNWVQFTQMGGMLFNYSDIFERRLLLTATSRCATL